MLHFAKLRNNASRQPGHPFYVSRLPFYAAYRPPRDGLLPPLLLPPLLPPEDPPDDEGE
jgi:hypothetical protein